MSRRTDMPSRWRQAVGVVSGFARKGRLGTSTTALGRYTGARV